MNLKVNLCPKDVLTECQNILLAILKNNELHFIITGSKTHKPYKVEMVFNKNTKLLKDDLSGITAARRFIAQYVYQRKIPSFRI